MPKEKTARLKLNNPSTGEFDWDKAWWDNTRILDNHPGIKVLTTSTLPEEPWIGQFVFNVDIFSLLVWNGQNWVNQSSGMFDFVQAGEDIAGGKVVYLNSDGKIYTANNSLPENYNYLVLGMSINEISTDETGLIKRSGLIRNPNWELIAGQVYYLGPDGDIIDTLPDEGLRLTVGAALSYDSLSIRIWPV